MDAKESELKAPDFVLLEKIDIHQHKH